VGVEVNQGYHNSRLLKVVVNPGTLRAHLRTIILNLSKMLRQITSLKRTNKNVLKKPDLIKDKILAKLWPNLPPAATDA
jgi:hypothetical protein